MVIATPVAVFLLLYVTTNFNIYKQSLKLEVSKKKFIAPSLAAFSTVVGVFLIIAGQPEQAEETNSMIVFGTIMLSISLAFFIQSVVSVDSIIDNHVSEQLFKNEIEKITDQIRIIDEKFEISTEQLKSIIEDQENRIETLSDENKRLKAQLHDTKNFQFIKFIKHLFSNKS